MKNQEIIPNAFQGLGMSAPTVTHQRVLGKMHINYLKKFGNDDNCLLGVAVMDAPERIPDISIWENVYEVDGETFADNPLLTIEITHTTRNDKYSAKSIRETFAYLPTLREAFIYNYATNKWTRYRRTDKGVEKEDDKDHSQVLGIYLHTLVK